MKGLTFSTEYTFKINIQKPPADIDPPSPMQFAKSRFRFWNRYPTVRSARDALLSRDEWCFKAGGPFWHDLLYLDAALGELEHYESWVSQLEPFYVPYASAELAKVRGIV